MNKTKDQSPKKESDNATKEKCTVTQYSREVIHSADGSNRYKPLPKEMEKKLLFW